MSLYDPSMLKHSFRKLSMAVNAFFILILPLGGANS
jgi:hypothetical protein